MSKTNLGNFFEDFFVGQKICHATPRTVTSGEVTLYTGLFGTRFGVQSSDDFAKAIGYEKAPIDDLLTFHIVFGKTVPDISLNAVASLGYADCRFLAPVFPGDTLSTVSEIIGVKQNSNGKTGTVYVRSKGSNQKGKVVVEFVRWVLVRKRDENSPAPEAVVPNLPDHVTADRIGEACPQINLKAWDNNLSGSNDRWENYEIGEKIDHVDGMTVEEAEHQIATRLFQNTAKVHFNQHTEKDGRFGCRLIYGGYVISLARALSFNGLANGFHVGAINSGRHISPLFAGDTVYAWSQITDKAELEGRDDVGALRVRTFACKNHPCTDFPGKTEDNAYHENILLDIDYWLLMPK